MKIGLKPKHVGGFIKHSILPDDMSIMQARYDTDQMREREHDIKVKPFDYESGTVLA